MPRLAQGGSALIWSFHHAVADGSTMMDVAQAALWDEAPGDRGRRAAVTGQRRRPIAGGAIPAAGGATDWPAAPPCGETPHPWLRSPFDGHIDARRSVALVSVPLDAMRQAAAGDRPGDRQ